jgi:hypothetical protein
MRMNTRVAGRKSLLQIQQEHAADGSENENPMVRHACTPPYNSLTLNPASSNGIAALVAKLHQVSQQYKTMSLSFGSSLMRLRISFSGIQIAPGINSNGLSCTGNLTSTRTYGVEDLFNS